MVTLHYEINGFFSFRKSSLLLRSTEFKPITYRSIVIQSKNRGPIELLVDSNQHEVFRQIALWKAQKTIDTDKLNEWIETGVIFPGTHTGEKALFEVERKKREQLDREQRSMRFSTPPDTNVEMFVNVGSSNEDLELVHLPGQLASENITEDVTLYMRDRQQKYTNISQLLNDLTVYNTYNAMAKYVSENHHMGSDEHEDFLHVSMALNQTSLTQMLGHYMSEFYGEDRKLRYIPLAGYPGTMPPSTTYPELEPVEDLPLKNPMPWPYFQMLPMYARPPVAMPYPKNLVELAALNNMIDEEQVEEALRERPTVIDASERFVTVDDVIRYTTYAVQGDSYDPAIQPKHGSMISPNVHHIPHYFPAHGATVSEEEARLPLPEKLARFLNMSYFPDHPYNEYSRIKPNIDEFTPQLIRSAGEKEAKFRKERMEQFYSKYLSADRVAEVKAEQQTAASSNALKKRNWLNLAQEKAQERERKARAEISLFEDATEKKLFEEIFAKRFAEYSKDFIDLVVEIEAIRMLFRSYNFPLSFYASLHDYFMNLERKLRNRKGKSKTLDETDEDIEALEDTFETKKDRIWEIYANNEEISSILLNRTVIDHPLVQILLPVLPQPWDPSAEVNIESKPKNRRKSLEGFYRHKIVLTSTEQTYAEALEKSRRELSNSVLDRGEVSYYVVIDEEHGKVHLMPEEHGRPLDPHTKPLIQDMNTFWKLYHILAADESFRNHTIDENKSFAGQWVKFELDHRKVILKREIYLEQRAAIVHNTTLPQHTNIETVIEYSAYNYDPIMLDYSAMTESDEGGGIHFGKTSKVGKIFEKTEDLPEVSDDDDGGYDDDYSDDDDGGGDNNAEEVEEDTKITEAAEGTEVTKGTEGTEGVEHMEDTDKDLKVAVKGEEEVMVEEYDNVDHMDLSDVVVRNADRKYGDDD